MEPQQNTKGKLDHIFVKELMIASRAQTGQASTVPIQNKTQQRIVTADTSQINTSRHKTT
jgi:hypothetical protein